MDTVLPVVVLHVEQGGGGGLGGVGGDTAHRTVVQFFGGYGADESVSTVFKAALGGKV